MQRRQFVQSAAAGAGLAAMGFEVQAQASIDTLRIIVGFPPGGTTDAFARRIGEKLRGKFANNVIIDNKPGAGGQVGVMTLKNAPADGNTILYTPMSMLTIYPHSYSKLGYKVDELSPLTIGHASDHGFVVGPAVPASVTTLAQFIEWAKANPGKASIGNPGAGSMPHLLAARLAMLAGFQIINTPFAGSGPGISQVLGGQIAGMSSPLGDWLQHATGGKVRVLATSGPSRSPFISNVPTFRESGFPDLVVREWFGFFTQAAISQAGKDRLANALLGGLNQPDVADAMKPLAAHVLPTTQEELARRLKADSEFAGGLVKALGFKADS